MKSVLPIIVVAIVPLLNADQTAYNLLSQLVQPSEQKEFVKKSSVSYSEAAYHMAEGAAVTTAACLFMHGICKITGAEKQIKEEQYYSDYDYDLLSAGFSAFQVSPGLYYPLKYIKFKLDDSHKSQTDQDILNARARLTGSLLAVLGIGVAVYRSLND